MVGVTAGQNVLVAGQIIHTGAEVSWPVRVGAIPAPADCYQPRAATQPLRDAVDTGGTAVLTQVFSGLGGVGKSQLAAAYARDLAGQLDLLVWVSATSRDAIVSTYAQAALQLALATTDDPDHAATRFLSWLQTTERAWLVVLDDLGDPADLRGLWPDPARGRTVVTTRRTDASLITRGRRRVEVGLFTPTEAHDYLTQKLTDTDTDTDLAEAEELAADVGYLPLALAQAASFILNQGESCADYRRRLADRRLHLDAVFPHDAPADEYRATVAATLSISIDAADRLRPQGLAGPLLRVLAVLDPNGIPADILTTDAVTELLNTTKTPAEEVSARDCRDAATSLARLSLLTLPRTTPIDGWPGRLRVHGLVQRAATEHLPRYLLDQAR